MRHAGRPHIVVDPGGLDTLTVNQGQFRYVIDLLRGLGELRPAARFTVLGARPAPTGELADLFDADRSRWCHVHFPRPTGTGAMYREQFRLAASIARLKADVYHGLHTILPAWSRGTVVGTVHDLMYELFSEYAQAARSRPYRLYRWIARTRARRMICISATTAADVRRLWRIPESRIDTIHHGTTFLSSGGDASPIPGLPPLAPLIVSPYNLEPRKNLATMVAAFGRVLRDVPEARLVLYGRAAVTPGREAEFDRVVAALDLADCVIRLGFLPDDRLGALYRRATLFVFPSLYEGFGYPVLEAMAAGVCVVAREASAMAEVLGDAGVTVETACLERLAATILELLQDGDRRAALGRAGRDRAARFTVRRMALETLRSYERALGRTIATEPEGGGCP